MRSPFRNPLTRTRLNCEALEDRVTPVLAFALSGANLLSFDTAASATVTTTAITGVALGETLVGLDVRPATGQLYALGINAAGTAGTLYLVPKIGGMSVAATVVGSVGSVTPSFTVPQTPTLPPGGYG